MDSLADTRSAAPANRINGYPVARNIPELDYSESTQPATPAYVLVTPQLMRVTGGGLSAHVAATAAYWIRPTREDRMPRCRPMCQSTGPAWITTRQQALDSVHLDGTQADGRKLHRAVKRLRERHIITLESGVPDPWHGEISDDEDYELCRLIRAAPVAQRQVWRAVSDSATDVLMDQSGAIRVYGFWMDNVRFNDAVLLGLILKKSFCVRGRWRPFSIEGCLERRLTHLYIGEKTALTPWQVRQALPRLSRAGLIRLDSRWRGGATKVHLLLTALPGP